MGKKDRELVATKVALEEQWAYDRRQERMSYRQMRQAAALPVAQGGLGYSLSEPTLKARVDAYFAQIKDTLEMGIDERRARQEAEIDELIRLATSDIARARAAGDVKASADAELRLLRYQEREAKIFGTDAPQRVQADVTTRDEAAALAELNAELVALGLPVVSDPVDAELDIMLSRIPGRKKAGE